MSHAKEGSHQMNGTLLRRVIADSMPPNYNFEIVKTIHRIQKDHARHVALQFPEGLLIFATQISDILRNFCSVASVVVETPERVDKIADKPNRCHKVESIPCMNKMADGVVTSAARQREAFSTAEESKIEVTILGDVTYGACCIDDLTCRALGADLLVHYGHSCLVPISETVIPCLYVFVDIFFDPYHLVASIKYNFSTRKEICHLDTSTADCREPTDEQSLDKYDGDANNERHDQSPPGTLGGEAGKHQANGLSSHRATSVKQHFDFESNSPSKRRVNQVALLGTIQYASALHAAREFISEDLSAEADENSIVPRILIPQIHPLSAGEVLGCSSPDLNSISGASDGGKFDNEAVKKYDDEKHPRSSGCGESALPRHATPLDCVFVSDGRFHLESAMIQNPNVNFYRYDPFLKVLCREHYDHALFHSLRRKAISDARMSKSVGLILGTLGRQGSVGITERIQAVLQTRNVRCTIILMSELLPKRLNKMTWADSFIQVACPRLSIDWGHFFEKPVLNPYEAFVAFGNQTYKDVYPMDYYTKHGGPWTNYFEGNRMGTQRRHYTSTAKHAMIRARIQERRKQQLAQMQSTA